jgi:hypothetical protein
MSRMNKLFAALLLLLAAGCGEGQDIPAQQATTLAGLHYKAVLVAGDASLPVFDNATNAMAQRLTLRARVPQSDITHVSAKQLTGRSELAAVLDDIAALRPGPGQGCFVYITSHGVRDFGAFLSPEHEFLSPVALDTALAKGCGDAPTVVVVSACYSGAFAEPPMVRPNRIILTAARRDRPSFGCGAGRVYTVFDACLLGALDAGGPWQTVSDAARACVDRNEQQIRVNLPSEPQAVFGQAVAAMPEALPHS